MLDAVMLDFFFNGTFLKYLGTEAHFSLMFLFKKCNLYGIKVIGERC